MNHSPDKPSITFAGAVRDCAADLPGVLENINRISSLASKTAYVFVENDSQDNSKEVLSKWGNGREDFHVIDMDGLGQIPKRTLRLELARNAYIEYIKLHQKLKQSQYLFIFDMDEINIEELDLKQVQDAFDFLQGSEERAAIFPNQNGTYYDLWALREKNLCPYDIWEATLEYANTHNASDQEAFDAVFAKRYGSIPNTKSVIEVESAFGGFGIYKMDYVLRNPNPYVGSKLRFLRRKSTGLLKWLQLETCEHVHFNQGIRCLGGKLYIKTDLINQFDSQPRAINSSFFRSIIF